MQPNKKQATQRKAKRRNRHDFVLLKRKGRKFSFRKQAKQQSKGRQAGKFSKERKPPRIRWIHQGQASPPRFEPWRWHRKAPQLASYMKNEKTKEKRKEKKRRWMHQYVYASTPICMHRSCTS